MPPDKDTKWSGRSEWEQKLWQDQKKSKILIK